VSEATSRLADRCSSARASAQLPRPSCRYRREYEPDHDSASRSSLDRLARSTRFSVEQLGCFQPSVAPGRLLLEVGRVLLAEVGPGQEPAARLWGAIATAFSRPDRNPVALAETGPAQVDPRLGPAVARRSRPSSAPPRPVGLAAAHSAARGSFGTWWFCRARAVAFLVWARPRPRSAEQRAGRSRALWASRRSLQARSPSGAQARRGRPAASRVGLAEAQAHLGQVGSWSGRRSVCTAMSTAPGRMFSRLATFTWRNSFCASLSSRPWPRGRRVAERLRGPGSGPASRGDSVAHGAGAVAITFWRKRLARRRG